MILVSIVAKWLLRLVVALIGKKVALAIVALFFGLRAALKSPAGPRLRDAWASLEGAWQRATGRAGQGGAEDAT